LAQIYVAEKRPADAQKQFEAALQINPHNAVALAQFADFLTSQKEQSQAFARVEQYVSANPNDANGHLILGSLDFESKNYAISQAEFQHAIQLNPRDIQAYVRLGKVLEAERQIDAAIASYQKALDLQPNFPALETYVGNLYLHKGDLETARKYYNQSLSYDPNFVVAIANTAWVDAVEGKDLDIALGMAQKAKSMAPDTPSITDTLGWVQYKRADYAAAVPLLEDCVNKSPDSAEFRFHLGMALLGKGEKVKARENLETALRMNLAADEAQQAQQALAQLH
jgi:tetratricopeptide (TPR) repeat protein